jgi:hypothetical protein
MAFLIPDLMINYVSDFIVPILISSWSIFFFVFVCAVFSVGSNYIPLTRNLELVNYQNAQIILIGAREGKDAIKKDIGIEIKEEPETSTSADIFSKLKVRKEQVPVRPIIEGKLE